MTRKKTRIEFLFYVVLFCYLQECNVINGQYCQVTGDGWSATGGISEDSYGLSDINSLSYKNTSNDYVWCRGHNTCNEATTVIDHSIYFECESAESCIKAMIQNPNFGDIWKHLEFRVLIDFIGRNFEVETNMNPVGPSFALLNEKGKLTTHRNIILALQQ